MGCSHWGDVESRKDVLEKMESMRTQLCADGKDLVEEGQVTVRREGGEARGL